jgi:hypothetical protein
MYGRAEAMLEAKWPEKYNAIGHVGWRGRLYGSGSCRGIGWLQSRIYHGVWATAAFQPLCERESVASALPLMPEWYLVILALVVLGALAAWWPPLLVCLPMAALATAATAVQAVRSASATSVPCATRLQRLKRCAIIAALHIVQPAARLTGRLSYGLTPWRRQAHPTFALPRVRNTKIWSETWRAAEERLASIEALLKADGMPVRRGEVFDNWDLEVRGGLFASVRTRLGVEEYPGGRQYLHFRAWPTFCKPAAAMVALPAALAVVAGMQHATWGTAVLALLAVALALRALGDSAAATACLLSALQRYAATIQPAASDDSATVAATSARAVTPPRDRAALSTGARIFPANPAAAVRAVGPKAAAAPRDLIRLDDDDDDGLIAASAGANIDPS